MLFYTFSSIFEIFNNFFHILTVINAEFDVPRVLLSNIAEFSALVKIKKPHTLDSSMSAPLLYFFIKKCIHRFKIIFIQD